MPTQRPAPSSASVTPDEFSALLALYHDCVLKSFYQTKVKGDDERRERAISEDGWRYSVFPKAIKSRKEGEGITKEELERLVTWKITHQTNRPFLLPQIRKNDPADVKRCTAEARRLLATSKRDKPTVEDVKKALDKVCELRGVGPATGTLILSIFDSKNVPFFEDELYTWLCPGSSTKLKYNVKEYLDMVEKLEKVREGADMDLDAANFEKVAFVCQHWDLVEDSHRSVVEKSATTHSVERRDLKNEKEGEGRGGKVDVGLDEKKSDGRKDDEANAQSTPQHRSGTKRKVPVDNTVKAGSRKSQRRQK